MRRVPVRLIRTAIAVSFAVTSARPICAQQGFSPDETRLAEAHPAYFTVETVVLERLGAVGPLDEPLPPSPPGAADPIDDVSRIINIGRAVWKIIEANKPVVDVKTDFASAVPSGVTHADQLESWSAPEGTLYGLRAKNSYGTEVIRLRWQVLRTTGGRLKGKGRYLTGVTARPVLVEVMWGYRFSLSASVPSTTNAGPANDPVAAMLVALDWKIETPIKESRGAASYYVQGDGMFKDLNPPPARDLTRLGLPARHDALRW